MALEKKYEVDIIIHNEEQIAQTSLSSDFENKPQSAIPESIQKNSSRNNLLNELVFLKKQAFKNVNLRISFPTTPDPSSHKVLFIEKKLSSPRFVDQDQDSFTTVSPLQDVWSKLRTQLANLIQTLTSNNNLTQIALFGFIEYLLGATYFLYIFLVRGWRLEIVKNMGSSYSKENPIPKTIPNIFQFIRKGFTLFIMRSIYFLPHLLVLYFFSFGAFELIFELISWLAKNLMGDAKSFLDHFIKMLPGIIVSIIIEFVVTLLYFVFVWPIYRINMIKYAYGYIRGLGFLSKSQIKHSINVYKKNANLILGVCFTYLAINIFSGILISILTFFSFGIALFFAPIILLILRNWPIAYLYGWLGLQINKDLKPQ